jgi:hypothetical protein
MDGDRFDALARSLAGRRSRRSVIGGFLGAVAAVIASDRAEAARRCRDVGEQCAKNDHCCSEFCGPKGRTGRRTCACPSGTEECGAACLDPATAYLSDSDNCGACGNQCPAGTPCTNGSCLKPLGQPAGDPNECASGFVADGVCCDAACDGQCEACGNDGHCAPVSGAPVGGRPACAGDAPCGVCDGVSAACVYPGGETACGASSCANGVQTTSACNGAGACVSSQADCGLYLCGDTACRTSCDNDDQCVGAAYCRSGVCAGDQPNGEACDGPDQCQSGFCVDGVCCDTACEGACVACNLGVLAGTCSPVAGNATCGDQRVCCDGVCCAPNATCDGTACSATCQDLGEACGSCCGVDDKTICGETAQTAQTQLSYCCQETGGACTVDDDCCLVQTGEYGKVSCVNGICGGAGAACANGLDNACVSRACCGIGADLWGTCCPSTQVCDPQQNVCVATNDQPCATDDECASKLCCGSVCVERTEEHCLSCTDVCPSDRICHATLGCIRPRGDNGSPCDNYQECVSFICVGGVCTDNSCGGNYATHLQDETPCGSNGHCCGGFCVSENDRNNCGTCGNVCSGDGVYCLSGDCECEAATMCVGGTDIVTCRNGAGLCVERPGGGLACIDYDIAQQCDHACASDADCSGLGTKCAQGWSALSDDIFLCSGEWICVDHNGCCGQSGDMQCGRVLPDPYLQH